MANIKDGAGTILQGCTVLGLSGFPFSTGDILIVSFSDHAVSCSDGEQIATFSFLELAEISITGPGTVTTGGGFIGGGFGIDGALEGMAIAGVLNALTTKKKVHTFITLITNFGELHLHYGAMDPAPLRIYLSSVFTHLRRLRSGWLQEREQLIDAHLARGTITTEEAGTFRARLVSPPVWANKKAEAEAERLMQEEALDAGPKGMCPSCDKVIPLHSLTCRYCNANFDQYASWKVIPIS